MIVVKDVGKKLGNRQVLRDISFHVAPFECVGIIGKNGAGKTTLLNVLTGILRADCGFLRVNGCKEIRANLSALKKVVYISGMKPQLWSDMKLVCSYENCAEMYGIGKEHYKNRLEELVAQFGLSDCLGKTVSQLSLGQKMRAELVYALLPEPELLLLDEALVGIDLSMKEKIMGILRKLKEERKMTILYTSHNLMEIEKLCDRVLLLDEGRMIFDGKTEELMRSYAPEYQMEIKINGTFPDMEDLPVSSYRICHDVLSVRFGRQKIEAAEIIRHILAYAHIDGIKITEPTLEDTVRQLL